MTGSPQRAGRYVQQTTGYKAFIPEALPPQPDIEFDGELRTLLSQADRDIARLDAIAALLPNPDLFVAIYVRHEAVLSSQIEGTQSTLEDVLAFEAQGTSNDTPKDVEEVINYVRAMNHGLRRLNELPLSLRLVREIHGELMHNVRGGEKTPGEFRTSQNWIGPAGSTLTNASFVPPPPHELMNALGALEKFLHEGNPMPTLDWLNRAHAFTTAAQVPYRLLETVSTHGEPAQRTTNLLIQGDNLEALKALLPFYRGQVKCIFIDPPYNTKSAFEHYDDNLEHSQWLSMMLPRLQLLRELLSEDGSIWVTIDDNEGHYLKVLMDEVFGRRNFVANVVWQKIGVITANELPAT
jgi:hypothetical protein